MQFHFHANQSHFHKNGFALRLALKQRHKGTRKWPIEDPRVLWDYVKYKIRQETITYSKFKARVRRAT